MPDSAGWYDATCMIAAGFGLSARRFVHAADKTATANANRIAIRGMVGLGWKSDEQVGSWTEVFGWR
jgi:hypothetical protein